MIDVRFPTALQMMLSLALAHQEGVPRLSSTHLASGVSSNPTFVRKLLTPLIKAGLLLSAPGRDGGVGLARPPDGITIAAIYEALLGPPALWSARAEIPHQCLVSCNFEAYFSDLAQVAGDAVRDSLARRTLADALVDLHHLGARTSRGDA